MDYYRILQINNNASQEEIKKAYKRLSRKFHPDNAGAEGREMFEQIQKAYEILGNESKREAYDKQQTRDEQKKNDWANTKDIERMRNNYMDLQGFYQGNYQASFESFFGFSSKTEKKQSEQAVPLNTDKLFYSFFGKK